MPPVMVQDNTETVDEASVNKQVQAKDKQVGTNERRRKDNDVTFQQEDWYTSDDRQAYYETDTSHIVLDNEILLPWKDEDGEIEPS